MFQKYFGFSAVLIVLIAVPVAYSAAQHTSQPDACCEDCVLSGCDDCTDGNCICEPTCCEPVACECCEFCGCIDCGCDEAGCVDCEQALCTCDAGCQSDCCASVTTE